METTQRPTLGHYLKLLMTDWGSVVFTWTAAATDVLEGEVMRLWPEGTVYIHTMPSVLCTVNTWHIITHYIIRGLFFSLCRIPFTWIYQLLFLCCYHRDTPSLSARRLWLPGSLALTGERHWWASVSLARLRHQCSERHLLGFDSVSLAAGAPQTMARQPVLSLRADGWEMWNPIGRDPLL